ncbi:MAG: hypothetical protein DRQ37_05565 [Gammaproteobacteria bacterium]|nr:MAG: hypothetical protein DRQ37_05565 [Gammaproteobacteria bacterium]
MDSQFPRATTLATACFLAGIALAGGAAVPSPMVHIPAGPFVMGSTAEEREYGYRLDEARGSTAARRFQWFVGEKRRTLVLSSYLLDREPVTNQAYQRFVQETGGCVPQVDRQTWDGYGLVHPYTSVARFIWTGGRFPTGRGRHPVVLVTQQDAAAFCRWRGEREGRVLRLPTETEWEKAARGGDGRIFPWGNDFDPKRLNSADAGPYDTQPVGNIPAGASPYGILDMAGMVFEWTADDCAGEADKVLVKGGSWDDYPGVTRAAARHCRARALKHILIGFRCAGELNDDETTSN